MLRGLPQTSRGLERVAQFLAAGTADTFLVIDGTTAAGKTVRELDLATKTDANIVAVVRGDKPIVNPPPDFRLMPADTLVLVGTHASMDKAFEHLSESPRSDV
jgi:K+/H+ antiporter YhaU regulatory subunit KhtT